MSEEQKTAPLLEGFALRPDFSDHQGVRCCHAVEKESEKRYVLKTISLPPSPVQAQALLYSGAFANEEALSRYYGELAQETMREIALLNALSERRGYAGTEGHSCAPMDTGLGWQVQLLLPYRRTLAVHLQTEALSEREAVQLGIDLCSALALCREEGWMYVSARPENIVKSQEEWHIGDVGFVELKKLHYAALPERYRSVYTTPEVRDAFATVNTTMDTYALGLTLYQLFNGGRLPFPEEEREAWLTSGQDPVPPYCAGEELSRILCKAIDRSPRNRYQTPEEFGHALIDYLNTHTLGEEPMVVPEPEPEPEPLVEEFVLEEFFEIPSEEEVPMQSVAEPIPEEEPQEAPAVTEEPEPTPEEEPVPEEAPVFEAVSPEEALLFEEAPMEEDSFEDTPAPEAAPPIRVHRKLVVKVLLALVAAAVVLALWLGYKNYYLQRIDALTCQGKGTSLLVTVETELDLRELRVLCRDHFGNTRTGTFINGIATFEDLTPGTQYLITLETTTLREFRGQTTAAYSTPAGTRITHLTAVTGKSDGSAILSFGVEGMDSDSWTMTCAAQGETERTFSFAGHTLVVTGLTVGTEYTFTLSAPEDIQLEGVTAMTHTASALLYPEELAVASYDNNTLTLTWTGAAEGWMARCSDGLGYDQLIECTDTTAVFENVTPGATYTIEVTASGQTLGKRIEFEAKSE